MINANQTIINCLQQIVKSGKPIKLEDVGVFQGYVFGYNKDYPDAIDVVSMDNSIVIRGVSLSAVYGNKKGIIVRPTVHSEVTVLLEGGVNGYVISFSHLDDHSTISRIKSYIGVSGVKPGTGEEDYDELQDSDMSSGTEYTDTHAVTLVKSQSGESKISVEVNSIINQASSTSLLSVTDKKIEQKINQTIASLMDGSFSVDAVKISLGKNATENSVLGLQLQAVLNAFIDSVASITTTTSLGTMPIMNIPQVQALKAEVVKILSKTNFIE